jgi:hypothetical protein
MSLPDQIQAQEKTVLNTDPARNKNITIAVHPFYLSKSGLRFDFEQQIKNTPSWIQAGIAGYFMSNTSNHTLFPVEELRYSRGFSLDLNYKRFFNKKESLYFAAGSSYSHYNIEYVDTYWRSYTEDGLVYHVNEYGDMNQKINKWGISTYCGYQKPASIFLFDVFVGLGYRHSFRTNQMAKLFDDKMISLGYTGVVFITGVRLGVNFKHK